MRVKGVLFDWGFTLAHPEPDGDVLYQQCALKLGVAWPLKGLFRAIHEADNQVPEGAPPRYRREKDRTPFLKWWDVLLAHIGGDLPEDTKLKISGLASHMVRKVNWALYDDVIPFMKELKKRGLVLGLVSNVTMDRAGLEKYLDITVTAQDVGAGKPAPVIFLEALKRAGLKASEVLYVGDQYKIDIIGANNVGIKAVLIDRYGFGGPGKECICIGGLSELTDYL
ncbi:HAD family hydrolase [Chloroflexota bacterium]